MNMGSNRIEPEKNLSQYRNPQDAAADAAKTSGAKKPNKLLIIALAVVVLAAAIALVIKLTGDAGNSAMAGKQHGDSAESKEALKAYNTMLSRESFSRDDSFGDSEVWHSENCAFDIAYIDDDDIPELIVMDTVDSDYSTGWGQLYTYSEGEIIPQFYMSLHSESGAAAEVATGYYEGTGYCMDYSEEDGYGTLDIYKLFDEEAPRFTAVYEPDENGETYPSYYTVDVDEVDEKTFYKRLAKETGDVELTPYQFVENTEENRALYLGTFDSDSEADEGSAVNDAGTDIINGETFGYLGKTFKELEEECGSLSQQGAWGGSLYYTTPDEKWLGFWAVGSESGETPPDAPCLSYYGSISEIFNVSDDISLKELADLLGQDFGEGELDYDPDSDMSNVVIWYVEYDGNEYKVIIDYDEQFDIVGATLTNTDR